MFTIKRPRANVPKWARVLGLSAALSAGFACAQTVDVIEFYNTNLNHYFVTADAAEAEAIDAGAAGAGWVRTGQIFAAYNSALNATKARPICTIARLAAKAAKSVVSCFDSPAAPELPSAPDLPTARGAVCRFYASGPNSHFYTAKAAECDMLKQIEQSERALLPGGFVYSGWSFEGIAFQVDIPDDAGLCPTGKTNVYRTYNNRFQQNDSNHRFVVGDQAHFSMISNGWMPEGIAFCSSNVVAGVTPVAAPKTCEELLTCPTPAEP